MSAQNSNIGIGTTEQSDGPRCVMAAVAEKERPKAVEEASREQCEALLVSSLSLIRQLIGFTARHHRLGADEAEEFAAVVQLRLIENDYGILRKFRGGSSLRTFLTVVIQRMLLDYRDAQWGKWRPSARARRLGGTAMLLERLTMRDGLTFEEACEVLDATHPGPVDKGALARFYAQLRRRSRPRFVTDLDLDLLPARRRVSGHSLIEAEDAETVRRATTALAAVVGVLDQQDRRILSLRFAKGLSIADISRTLQLDQKPLYVRIARLMRGLRQQLEAHGVCGAAVLAAIAGNDRSGTDVLSGAEPQPTDVRPSDGSPSSVWPASSDDRCYEPAVLADVA